jgi:acetyl esterase/lipase
LRALLLSALLALAPMTAAAEPPLLTFAELAKRPRAKADARIAYGDAPSQFVELWRPEGAGPHPVVVLVHGGCWQARYPGLELLDYAAEDLRRRGFAVWNVEHRRIDEPGGGYPGTFLDVGAAFDLLRTEAPKHGLSLERVVAAGHSAGGHLALWAASRPALPSGSPLRTADPLPVAAVVSLGGLGDLEAAAADPASRKACGEDTVARLVDAAGRGGDVYADTSPARLPSMNGLEELHLHGERDHIAPFRLAEAYTKRKLAAEQTDDTHWGGVMAEVIPNAGHFEPIAPGGPAWDGVVLEIERLSQNR